MLPACSLILVIAINLGPEFFEKGTPHGPVYTGFGKEQLLFSKWIFFDRQEIVHNDCSGLTCDIDVERVDAFGIGGLDDECVEKALLILRVSNTACDEVAIAKFLALGCVLKRETTLTEEKILRVHVY